MSPIIGAEGAGKRFPWFAKGPHFLASHLDDTIYQRPFVGSDGGIRDRDQLPKATELLRDNRSTQIGAASGLCDDATCTLRPRVHIQ